MKIDFKNKTYELEKEKVLVVLSKLCGKTEQTLNSLNEEDIKSLMEEFELFDEIFLENINKI